MENRLRVHIGSGNKHWPGWVNCDSDYDLKNLPFKEVDEICGIHLFEHLPRDEVDSFLTHWHSILKDDGVLTLEMPSMDKIAQSIVSGEKNQRLTILGIFGDAHYNNPLMLHRWCYTNAELEEILTKNGFSVEFKEPVFHYQQRDLRLEARKI